MIPSYIGSGFADRFLSEDEASELIERAFQEWDVTGQRILVIIPDSTRTAPIPFIFKQFHKVLHGRVKALDYLVALGTHPVMSEAALGKLVGISAEERSKHYSDLQISNHRWDRPDTFVQLGTISPQETTLLSRGMLSLEVPVRINRKVLEYDLLIVCGPVFPHEVVGFSGGNKYFFPGISGPEVINFTHWLGALITSFEVIGTRSTPVREVIDLAAAMIPTPKLFFCPVVKAEGLSGLYIGEDVAAWQAAADLSARVHVRYLERPVKQVISQLPPMYDDLWTGAKGMYKAEPVVAEGGEVIIYSPWISEISYTHGRLIDQIGYHVRDYFVNQWDRFRGFPWGVLAHSTHLRGIGTYEDGIERPRVQVSLATAIPRERCEQVCLGYRPLSDFHPEDWKDRDEEGILFIPHAGETLFRLKNPG